MKNKLAQEAPVEPTAQVLCYTREKFVINMYNHLGSTIAYRWDRSSVIELLSKIDLQKTEVNIKFGVVPEEL